MVKLASTRSKDRFELYKQSYGYIEDDYVDVRLKPSSPEMLSSSDIIERSSVPESHRKAADGFMIIKKIFGHPVVQSMVTEEEKSVLLKYCLKPLEKSTAQEIKDEFRLLKELSNSKEDGLRTEADRVINIRSKELKYMISTNFVNLNKDMFNGYKYVEKYFENISKY